MIPDVARYHGVVLRQLVIEASRPLVVSAVDSHGRVDCFRVDRGVIHIKHSAKRLSPWQFTFVSDQLSELRRLRADHELVWVMLLCGIDGVAALRWSELESIINVSSSAAEWVKVSRSRNTQYRITGSAGELQRRKAMGTSEFLDDIQTNATRLGTAE